MLLWMRLAMFNSRLGYRWRKRMLVIDWNADHTPPEYGITSMRQDAFRCLGHYSYDHNEPRRVSLARLCRRAEKSPAPRRVKEIIGIPHAEMVAWINSWGAELPLPRPTVERADG